MSSRISQSLSFHQSPESFIARRLQNLLSQQYDGQSTPIIRAEILNRNVHIIPSYRLCKQVLGYTDATTAEDYDQDVVSTSSFAAGPAYEQLMEAFFPRPNLLLQDGEMHSRSKSAWRSMCGEHLVRSTTHLVHEITSHRFSGLAEASGPAHQLDLYETMKLLAWDILFAIFLGLKHEEGRTDFNRIQNLQETVLQGQFSLFPVSFRTPFWTSARSRGLKAVRDLGPAIKDCLRLQKRQSSDSTNDHIRCPFINDAVTSENEENSCPLNEEEIISNVRLFTSSLANKALASLLTAYLLNLFLWKISENPDDEASLASLISTQNDTTTRAAMLHSILSETERCSPPVVGVMRRATQTVVLDDDHTIPAGHDAWLYFVAANRDPDIFDHADSFQWDRFMTPSGSDHKPCGMAFGAGTKRCLGANLSHEICLTVADAIINSGISLRGQIKEEGVRGWLGWQPDINAESMAKDVKQLPCQRPRKPIMLTIRNE